MRSHTQTHRKKFKVRLGAWVKLGPQCHSGSELGQQKAPQAGDRRGVSGPTLCPSACREHSREQYEVKMGAHQLDSYNNETVVRTVAQIIAHSSYREEGSQGDIALVRLSSPVTFSRYIRPICLPAANASFPNGLQCTVTGWGHVAPSGEAGHWVPRDREGEADWVGDPK